MSIGQIFGDIGYLFAHSWQLFLQGIASTLILSIVGTVVGLIIGVLLAFCRNIKILGWFCKGYSVVIRGTPMMVQALIFKYTCQLVFKINWNQILPGVPVMNGWLIAGLVVITFNTAAYMCEIVRSGLNGVDKGQIEGAKSLGMTNFQTLIHVTLPQALRNSLPTIGNEWVVNIKDSSVLNIIGVTELFAMAEESATTNYKYLAAYIIIALVYLLMTLGATGILKLLENKIDGKKYKFSLFHFKPKERGA